MQHAKAALAAGTDSLVAQGNEAGGHTGSMNLLPFLARARSQTPARRPDTLPDRFQLALRQEAMMPDRLRVSKVPLQPTALVNPIRAAMRCIRSATWPDVRTACAPASIKSARCSSVDDSFASSRCHVVSVS
jgi:hypothetical protein